jgi:hypothetical protein
MISLINPSRGRAEKSLSTAMKWVESCGVDVELIVSLDSDDDVNKYINTYSRAWFLDPFGPQRKEIIINNNSCLVEATNKAAAVAKGDILVYLSDDFDCFQDWGKVLVEEFAKYPGPTLLKVDDMLQPFHIQVLTIPIMNRQCHESLGYFFHPGYKSMFVDEHLYHRTRKLGFLKMAPHIKFEHKHVSVGKADNDETYRRSAANWDQGKALMAEHRRMGFTV